MHTGHGIFQYLQIAITRQEKKQKHLPIYCLKRY